VSYEEVRPWAPLVAHRAGIRDRMGAMPPWYIERDIGIQDFKNDPSLSDEEVAIIDAWVAAGAPEGDPSRIPPPRNFEAESGWTIRPDIVVRTQDFSMEAFTPDQWVDIEDIVIPVEGERYVAAIEFREVNDIDAEAARAAGLGGNFIIHHMIWSTRTPAADGDGIQVVSWPVHEIGRNADMFDARAGRPIREGSTIMSRSVHLSSTSIDATGHLEIAFQLHPEGYQPEYSRRPANNLGDAVNIDLLPNQVGQELHAYEVLNEHTKIISFEPHLHASGARMCMEAIWGFHRETIACAGYDHNWVRTYYFEDHAQPLLPAGTVLHLTAYMDTTPENPNIYDSRNWQGSGNRTISNMFLELGERLSLTEEQFAREMAERREVLGVTKNDYIPGCPVCLAPLPVPEPIAPASSADSDDR